MICKRASTGERWKRLKTRAPELRGCRSDGPAAWFDWRPLGGATCAQLLPPLLARAGRKQIMIITLLSRSQLLASAGKLAALTPGHIIGAY